MKEFDPYAEGFGILPGEGKRVGIGIHRDRPDVRTVPRNCRSNDSGSRPHVDDGGKNSGPENAQGFPNEGFGLETGNECPFVRTERQVEKLYPPGTVCIRAG